MFIVLFPISMFLDFIEVKPQVQLLKQGSRHLSEGLLTCSQPPPPHPLYVQEMFRSGLPLPTSLMSTWNFALLYFSRLAASCLLEWQNWGEGATKPGGGGALPIMDYTGRLRLKGVPFSGWRYIKGKGFHELKYRKGLGKLTFRY